MFEFNIIECDAGRDYTTNWLMGLLTSGQVSYFKLGEGGWSSSALYTNQFDTGDGDKTYSGIVDRLPLERNTVTISAGVQTLTDDGSGNLTGDGTGTVNYKTGAISVVFTSNVAISTAVNATYKYWGSLSNELTQEYGYGKDNTGTYFIILDYTPLAPSTITVTDGVQTLIDDGAGAFTGDGTGTVDYDTGEVAVVFTDIVPSTRTISVTYKYDGAPNVPDPTKTDLESESDANLYTFQKTLQSTDFTFQGENTGRVTVELYVELWEALDDGNGDPPFFFEGGLFNASDVLLYYFTFSKIKKDGVGKIVFNIDLVC